MNIVTEDSIKAVLDVIARDIKTKIGNDQLGSAIDEYFKNADTNSVDLQEAIVDIINNNIETIDINSIMPNLNDYATKSDWQTLKNTLSNLQTQITNIRDNVYTKEQITEIIGNISEPTNPEPEPQPTEPDEPIVNGRATSDFIDSLKLNLNGLDTTGIDGENESIYSNRILFLNDDFEGDALDENLFSMSDGREPNYKISTFKPANVTVHDSMMTLLGQKAESVDAVDGATRPFTGAEVITRLHFQNCLFEAKMRHPREYDWCTAFWTCGYNVTGFQNWSYCGEIDVFEDIHNEKKATFHYAKDNSSYHQHSTAMTSTVLDNTVYNAYKASGGDGQWHVYGCELMQGKVRLYFDYKPFIEYATSEQSYYEGVNVFNHWQHFIWDSVAWAKTATDMDYKLDVDWIRAWSLENETSSDLIPQSVQISYLGNEDRLAANGNIEVGTIAQLRPVYTPSTVPVVSNLNTIGHSTFTLSDNTKLSENGGAIIPIVNGTSSITFTDVFGTTATRQITGIVETLADGTDNLEDFDITTVVSKFGMLKYNNLNMDFSAGIYDTSTKAICYGLFKVDPSTEYQFSYSGSRSYTETVRVVQFTANKKVSKKTISLTSAGSFTTEPTTEYVLVQGTLQSSLILKDYKRVKQCFLNLNPSFIKVTN